MRPTLLALVVVLLIGSYACHDAAAEPGSRWWPFGRGDAEESLTEDTGEESTVTAPSQVEKPATPPETPAGEESDQRWMIDSPLAKVSWPRLHLPEVRKPQLPKAQLWPKKSEVDADRNGWAEEDPTVTPSSPWQSVTGGARRMGDSTRTAWGKTVDAITPGPGDNSGSTSSRVARREGRPPWWKRMFAVEDREPEGPQTVTEWMAQERLDP